MSTIRDFGSSKIWQVITDSDLFEIVLTIEFLPTPRPGISTVFSHAEKWQYLSSIIEILLHDLILEVTGQIARTEAIWTKDLFAEVRQIFSAEKIYGTVEIEQAEI